jgi:hypothetical protein
MEEALLQIKQWAQAYPVTVFTPLTEAQMHAAAGALKDAGIDMGALHAGWARHILNGIAKICDQGLADD